MDGAEGNYILECEGVSKAFSGIQALDDVQLKIEKGEVHALLGENGAGNSAQIQRGQGIHNILDKDPTWKLLDGAEQGADWQADKAVNFAMDWLAKFGTNLNAIICDNDDMSSAVQNYVNSRDRRDIVCIGVDGNVGPLNMVKNGDLQATVYQDGIGQVLKGIDLLMQIAKGQTVPKTTMIPFVLVTKDNVNQYLK